MYLSALQSLSRCQRRGNTAALRMQTERKQEVGHAGSPEIGPKKKEEEAKLGF